MVFWRARLPLQDGLGLPTTEAHTFISDNMAAAFYPIANGQCVWTVGAPDSKLQEAGVAVRQPKRSSAQQEKLHGVANGDATDARSLEHQRAVAGKANIEVHMLA